MPTLHNYPGCCGGYILVGFGDPKQNDYVNGRYVKSGDSFQKHMDTVNCQNDSYTNVLGTRGKVVQAILTDYQVTNYDGEWARRLKTAGFKLVARFWNSSGGMCNVFCMTTAQCGTVGSDIPNAPSWWTDAKLWDDAEARAKAAALAERRKEAGKKAAATRAANRARRENAVG